MTLNPPSVDHSTLSMSTHPGCLPPFPVRATTVYQHQHISIACSPNRKTYSQMGGLVEPNFVRLYQGSLFTVC